jgi:integral membrane protein (TIGR00529 family)
MWSLVGLVFAVLTISVSMRFKLHIGLALLLGSVVLGVFALSIPDLLQTIVQASIALSTVEMVLTLVSITFLNVLYQQTGKAQELAFHLGNMMPSRLLVAVIPVLFGILPVTGGALFSAPFVDVEGEKIGLTQARKAFLNMWFRHIPHLLYPLETALVIASHLTGVSLSMIILYQIPVFVVGLVVGYLVGLRGLENRGAFAIEWPYLRGFLLAFLPIIVALLLTVVLNVKLYLAVFGGSLLLWWMTRSTKWAVGSSLKPMGSMAGVGLGIMIFRHVSQTAGVWDVVVQLVQAHSLWPPLLLVALPLAIGFMLGESSPAITLSLSVLLALYPMNPPAVCLVYTCMYFGHLISPLHLCFSVTVEHFHTEIRRVYKRFLPATLATLMVDIPLMLLFAT